MKKTALSILCILIASSFAAAQPKSDLWPIWTTYDPSSTVVVDHSALDRFLDHYLETETAGGVNLVRYDSVSPADKAALDLYVSRLENVRVSTLNRDEQRAYWINLYNALTLKVILDHYPVDSIRDIKLSRGLFSSGPWEAKLVEIEGEAVSLDDIEHRILRPIWQDPRIHYAVNCASIGCPNLQPVAFTAENTEELFDRGAREYVNHPRGVSFDGSRLTMSSIYSWFSEDFEAEGGAVAHAARFAEPALARRLRSHDGRIRYDYDWSLNEPPQ